MTMPDDPIRDFMRRSLFNLRYIELSDDPEGQMRLLRGKDPDIKRTIKRKKMNTITFRRGLYTFEFTALISSFMTCMIHPWEQYFERQYKEFSLQEARRIWNLPIPTFIRNERSWQPETVIALIDLFRNAFAHGNYSVEPHKEQIWKVNIWNMPNYLRETPKPEKSKWTTTSLTKDEMRDFLFDFVRMTEDIMYDGGTEAYFRAFPEGEHIETA